MLPCDWALLMEIRNSFNCPILLLFFFLILFCFGAQVLHARALSLLMTLLPSRPRCGQRGYFPPRSGLHHLTAFSLKSLLWTPNTSANLNRFLCTCHAAFSMGQGDFTTYPPHLYPFLPQSQNLIVIVDTWGTLTLCQALC